jgi:hypothetical protein
MEFQMLMEDSESDDEHPFLDNGSLQGDSQVHDALLKAIAEYECNNIDNIATVYSP